PLRGWMLNDSCSQSFEVGNCWMLLLDMKNHVPSGIDGAGQAGVLDGSFHVHGIGPEKRKGDRRTDGRNRLLPRARLRQSLLNPRLKLWREPGVIPVHQRVLRAGGGCDWAVVLPMHPAPPWPIPLRQDPTFEGELASHAWPVFKSLVDHRLVEPVWPVG